MIYLYNTRLKGLLYTCFILHDETFCVSKDIDFFFEINFKDIYFLQIFELTVCSILSKKASTKISPNERMVNGTRDHEESLEIGSFDDDL